MKSTQRSAISWVPISRARSRKALEARECFLVSERRIRPHRGHELERPRPGSQRRDRRRPPAFRPTSVPRGTGSVPARPRRGPRASRRDRSRSPSPPLVPTDGSPSEGLHGPPIAPPTFAARPQHGCRAPGSGRPRAPVPAGSATPARGGAPGSRRSPRAGSGHSVEPLGEPLVEVCALFLRHRLVRGVTDQQMPEPERVLADELRPVGTDQFLARQREQPRANLRAEPFGHERGHGAGVEHLAFDRTRVP